MAKEICSNCSHSRPTYKGIVCDVKDKKVKTKDTCDGWNPKR